MLAKEPWNPYDTNAIAVHTLKGTQLGYVPKAHNQHYTKDMVFGRVVAFGQNDQQLWGAAVMAQPQLVPITLDPLPTAAVQQHSKQLQELLSGRGKWQDAHKEAKSATHNVCEVTGVPGTAQQPLQVLPVWRYDTPNRAVQLAGFSTVCKEVADAKQLLIRYQSAAAATPEMSAAIELLMNVNFASGDSEQELHEYLEFTRSRQRTLDEQGWALQL